MGSRSVKAGVSGVSREIEEEVSFGTVVAGTERSVRENKAEINTDEGYVDTPAEKVFKDEDSAEVGPVTLDCPSFEY